MVLCALAGGRSWSNIMRASKLKKQRRKQLLHPHRDSIFCSYVEIITTSEFFLGVEKGNDNGVLWVHVQNTSAPDRVKLGSGSFSSIMSVSFLLLLVVGVHC